ncbi:hypothetical protein PAMA_006852 [Pampus argenteus]
MKAISRQRQLFKSSPPCQPPFAPQQECGRVCVISLFATGQASLLLWCQAATAPPECRLHFQCQGAHPALPACMMAPAAGVSEALTVAPCRVALASALCQFHRVGAGGVCGQQATGKL